jgi:Tol biopolymer transport system component
MWRVAMEGGQPEQVTQFAGSGYEVSPDGKFIVITSGGSLGIVRSEDGQLMKTFQNVTGFARWTPDGRALTFSRFSAESVALWLLPLDSGKPRQLIDFKPDTLLFYAPSYDWKQLAVASGTSSNYVVLISEVK